jgi:uncharacterized protein (UPF0332 family)
LRSSKFIEVARALGDGGVVSYGDVHLRRATSTAYYALFHHVCEAAASLFVGRDVAAMEAYRGFYRAFDHARMRSACEGFTRDRSADTNLRFFADTFLRLQGLRHLADYDPSVSFTGRDLKALVIEAETRSRRSIGSSLRSGPSPSPR